MTLVMLSLGGVLWLLFDAMFFQFRSALASCLLLLLSYGVMFLVALQGTAERADEAPAEESAPPTP